MSIARVEPRPGGAFWPTRSRLALTAVVAVVSGAAGFALGQLQRDDQVTYLTIATCGLDAAPAPVALPLRDLLNKADGHAVSIGPFRHDGLDRAVTVRFAPGSETPKRRADGADGDLLVLPVRAMDADMPDEIRLECRYGIVSRVQFRNGPAHETFDLTLPATETMSRMN